MMSEIENCVEVRVTGPQDQLDLYVNWLKMTTEYQYESGFNKWIPASALDLCHANVDDSCWRYLSSNIKRKIKSMYRWKLNELEFRVNYMVYYGTYPSSDGTLITHQETDYERGIFPGLVESFNPLPSFLKSRCKDLVIDVCWGSYYIERDFMHYAFEGDHAI